MVNYLHYLDTPALWKESGSRIRKRRLSLGIKSRNAFSEQIGKYTACGPDTIKAIESGREPIKRLAPLGAICTVLDCDPEYITCQCDTLRKENADPVQRFGLSEQSFAVLEQNTGKESIAPAIDFVLCSGNVRQALKSLLTVYESISETETAFPACSRPKDSDDTQLILTDDFSGMLIPKTDFITDPYGQYIVSTKQAAFIAEQQLIAEIRKAFER